MRAPLSVAVLLFCAVPGRSVRAQDASRAFFEVTVGPSVLAGNHLIDGWYHEGRSGSTRLSIGVQPDSGRPAIGAVHAGFVNLFGSNDCALAPLGGCKRGFPVGTFFALTVGARPPVPPWNLLEVTAGPAFVTGAHDFTSFAALVTARFGLPPGHHVSPGVGFYGLLTPMDGSLRLVAGMGISFRTW